MKAGVPEYKVLEFFSKKTKYCLGIPVINEGKKFIKQLHKMRHYSKIIDIIIFDGGSTDGSTDPKFLENMGVRALITTETGQSRQLLAGFDFAIKEDYEGVITIDGNGKDGVEGIPLFIKALDKGYDYIQGSRFIKGGQHENTPTDRLIIARFFISPLLSLAAGYWYTDTPNAFRGYSSRYLLHPKVLPFRKVFVRYELLFYLTIRANRLGLKTIEIPVTRNYPKGKIPTKITGFKKILDFINIIRVALGFYNPPTLIF